MCDARTGSRRTARPTTFPGQVFHDEYSGTSESGHFFRIAAFTEPKIAGGFELPETMTDLERLSIAQGFAINATPLASVFPRFAPPADFLAPLNAAIADSDIAPRPTTAKTEATAAIDAIIERGMVIVKQPDVIVKNTFRTDDAVLAAWKPASHPEWTRSKAAPEAAKATTPGR